MNRDSLGASPNKARRRVRHHDERAARSRGALHGALTALLHEKPFGDITVQDLLQRADVGRATFYAHFQDKDDLLLTSFTCLLEAMTGRIAAESGPSRRLLPVREFFEHVGSARTMLATFTGSEQLATMWRLAALHFAKSIEGRLGSPLRARLVAGAMIETLQWWLDQRNAPDAAAVDREFHASLRSVGRA